MLAHGLSQSGLGVTRQKPISFVYDGVKFDEGFRADLFVEDSLIIELKSVERLAPVHAKQLLTYLRLTEKPLGLLMNFGAETFKEGCKRVVNNHTAFAPSRASSPDHRHLIRGIIKNSREGAKKRQPVWPRSA